MARITLPARLFCVHSRVWCERVDVLRNGHDFIKTERRVGDERLGVMLCSVSPPKLNDLTGASGPCCRYGHDVF